MATPSLALLTALAAISADPAGNPAEPPTTVERLESIRQRYLESLGIEIKPQSDAEQLQLTQWGNFPNFPNFPNFSNFSNFPNFPNWFNGWNNF